MHINRTDTTNTVHISNVLRALTLAMAWVGVAAFTQAAPGAAAQTDDLPVALAAVNGDTIYTTDIDRELIGLHVTMSAERRRSFDYRKLLGKLINDRLLAQEARALGIDQDGDLQAALRNGQDRQIVALFAKDHFHPDLEIPESEILKYYDTYYARLQLRTVAVRTLAEAQTIRARIMAGASMDSIAREVSLDMYRYGGGLHNNKFYIDIEPVLRDPSDRLAIGALSDPVPFRDAYSLIRVEQRAPADRGQFDSHRATIVSILQTQSRRKQWAAFVAELERSHPVTVDNALMNQLRADAGKLFTPQFTDASGAAVLSASGDATLSDRTLRTIISRSAMEAAQTPFDSLLERAVTYGREEVVLRAAAFAAGYRDKPAIRQSYATSLDSALVEVYLQETVVPQIAFTREEFEQYYEDHLAEFTSAPACQFLRMTIADDTTASVIHERLGAGADFAYLAKQYGAELSTPEESAEWISLETFPAAIRSEIEALRIGQAAAPHATTDGWLILKLKARRDGTPKPFGECHTTIQSRLFQQKFDSILDSTLSILKQNSSLWYNDVMIDTYFGADS